MTVTYTVGVDWDGDGDFDGTGEDVTARTKGAADVAIRLGRDQARALSPAAPGEARLELDNRSRDYSPENGSSPLAGLVLPGRGVKITAGFTPVDDTYTRTSSSTWTTADSGHAWSHSGGDLVDYRVSGGLGLMDIDTINAVRLAWLPSAAYLDGVTAATGITPGVVATGDRYDIGLIGRMTDLNNYYMGVLRFQTDSTVDLLIYKRVAGVTSSALVFDLTTGFTYTSASDYTGEFSYEGATLTMTAWNETNPSVRVSVTVQDTDLPGAGSPGVRGFLGSANTNPLPVGASFNTFTAVSESTLFRGHLDDFDVLPDFERRAVDVSCLDPLAKLKGVRVTTGLHRGLLTGDAIAVVLDAAGWDPGLRVLDRGATVVPWFWLDDADAYDAVMQLVDSEGPPALLTADGDSRIVFRGRHHRLLDDNSTTVMATFDDSTEPALSPPLVYDHGWRDIVNSIVFATPVRAASGVLSPVWSSSGQISVADGETLPVSAKASEPFTDAVTPVAGTDFQLLSGAVTMTLSATSGASLTVFVTATGGPALISDLQVRGYPLQTVTTVEVSAEDSTSIGRYGKRSLQQSRDPVWAGVNDVVAIADIIIGQRAERLPTVTVTMRGGSDVRLRQQLFRNLSDRVHVTDAESGLDADCHIEQIQHSAGQILVTRFGCEKVQDPPTGLLILDDPALGLLNTGALGGAGVSDPDTVFVLDTSLLNTGALGY